MAIPEVGGYGLTVIGNLPVFVDDVDITAQCKSPNAYPLTKTQTFILGEPSLSGIKVGTVVKINGVNHTIDEGADNNSFDFEDTNINIELVSYATGFAPYYPLEIYYTSSTDGGGDTMTFKHYFKGAKIGTGNIAFRDFAPVPTLAQVENVTVDGTTLSWDEVENATSYDIYADGTLIGNTDGGGAVTLIDFTIAGTAYQAEEGMTWEQWIDSKYNTDGYVVGRYHQIAKNTETSLGVIRSGTNVQLTDSIITGYAYDYNIEQ